MAARKGIAAVVARRAEEDRIARVKDDIGASAKVLAMATFEARTGARIAKAATVAEAERARAALAEELRKRRNALAELLAAEQAVYEAEIKESFATPEETKTALFDYARQLKADREASRAQFVAECEERRWRESCDVLRDKESKEYVRNIAADRRGQLAERAAAAAAAAEAERVFVRQSEAEKARVDAREEFDRARLRKLNADCRLTLEEQVTAHEKNRAAHREAIAAMQQAARDEAAEAERGEAAAAEAQREAVRIATTAVEAANQRARAERDRARSKERQSDIDSLQLALDRERAVEEEERKTAAERRAASAEYQRQIEAQMAAVAEETSYLDTMQMESAEAEWMRREAKWAKEAAAREKLMGEVKTAREAQLRRKAALVAADREAGLREAQAMAEEVASNVEEDAARVATKRATAVVARGMLEKQISAREEDARSGAQQSFLESRVMAREESRYASKVEGSLAAAQGVRQDFKRSTTKWYT